MSTSRLCAPGVLLLVMLTGVVTPVVPERTSGSVMVPLAEAIDGVASVPEDETTEPVTVMTWRSGPSYRPD